MPPEDTGKAGVRRLHLRLHSPRPAEAAEPKPADSDDWSPFPEGPPRNTPVKPGRWEGPRAKDYRRTDRMGRIVPRMLPVTTFLEAIGGVEHVREAPSSAIVEERENEVLVQCPCGGHPVVEPDIPWGLTKCVGCERSYKVTRGRLFVVYGDRTQIPGLLD